MLLRAIHTLDCLLFLLLLPFCLLLLAWRTVLRFLLALLLCLQLPADDQVVAAVVDDGPHTKREHDRSQPHRFAFRLHSKVAHQRTDHEHVREPYPLRLDLLIRSHGC